MSQAKYIPLDIVCKKVKQMTNSNSHASNMINSEGLSINSVSWEDCARNKGSCWGPNISDMTLQVNKYLMPVIREDNFKDKTWDVNMDKIPIVIGNETSDKNTKLKTVSLREYLSNFDKYMSHKIPFKKFDLTVKPKNNMDNPFNWGNNNNDNNKMKDTHVIMSSQCCILPIEKGKETKFSVAVFNYQSSKNNPAVLCIVSTSKGTSAQIIENGTQQLLFNNNGVKSEFIAQRLSDNRIERGVSVEGPMTKQEKQDNCIIVIQVPLKRKINNNYNFNSNNGFMFGVNNSNSINDSWNSFSFGSNNNNNTDCFSWGNSGNNNNSNYNNNSSDCFGWNNALFSNEMSKAKVDKPDIENAIIKVIQTKPMCICGGELTKLKALFCYTEPGSSYQGTMGCDGCGKSIKSGQEFVWHCKKKSTWQHKHGYDLCLNCGDKQLKFKELNGMDTIERDPDYPIRVTVQYYKSTINGIITKDIIKSIKKQLQSSQKQSDFIGSLVVNNSNRPTEFNKKPQFMWTFDQKNNDNNNDNNNSIVILKKALKELKLETYLQSFIDNEVFDSDLINIVDDDDLKELIPKLGPRSRFKKMG